MRIIVNVLIQIGMENIFTKPKREILTIFDISKWYKSVAYVKYLNFLKRINKAVKSIPTNSDNIVVGESAQCIINLLDALDGYIDKYPAEDMGAQRFGNKAYRKWYERVSSEVEDLVRKMLPTNYKEASIEFLPYLLDSFGNSTRIDYGSGHEACFLIFIYCFYEIGVLNSSDDKAVVLRVFHRYLKLVRRLQITYRMEPAGSRGVHALDDFQFVPFIFGSAQLIDNSARLVPDHYLRPEMVQQYQNESLFLEAVQFINETKTGLFYEHSNQLYNISAVTNWPKVNEGMFKMYEAEVLKKFPVVQHFVFGSLFPIRERENLSLAETSGESGLEMLAHDRHPVNRLNVIPE